LEIADTTFSFVTEGLHSALERARVAAGEHDIRLGGGASVVRALLARHLIDRAHFAVVPTVLGGGERVFDNGVGSDGYDVRMEPGDGAVTHYFLERR
jgi:dihydrofolate reductase